jgi:hypothetical protein
MKPGLIEADEQDFYPHVVAAIERRYQITAHKSLWDVYALDADFLNTEADADFAIRNRNKILDVLANPEQFERLVQVFLNQTIEFAYASNQFIQFNAREEAELRRIYTAYLRKIQAILATSQADAAIAGRLRTLVAGHFGDLRANLIRFFDPETRGDARANVILNRAVCAEYSPVLQMEILGLRLADLLAPVLDIGCGKSGALVRYLNENGVKAVGIDRVVDTSPDLVQADWLDLSLEPGGWGTILSHMAFSNHFVFQHLYTHGKVEPYARQFMAILRALKPGGSFHYTPGLPFIEAYLPGETYRVTQRHVKESVYACQVLRIR